MGNDENRYQQREAGEEESEEFEWEMLLPCKEKELYHKKRIRQRQQQ